MPHASGSVGPVAADVTLVELDGRFAAFVPRADDVIFFNETASAILRHCDGTLDLDGVVAAVASDFRVPACDIKPDVEQAVFSFAESGLFGDFGDA